jgi:hypothetical protein
MGAENLFLGAFAYPCKCTNQLRHVCMSACISAAPTERISVKSDTGGAFMKVCRGAQNLGKNGQKYPEFQMKT